MLWLRMLNVQIFLLVVQSNYIAQQCSQSTLQTRYGFVLKGHAFLSFISEKLVFCTIACNTNPACQSLNYNLANKTCDFNSEFIKSQPDSLHKSDFHVYADNPDRGKKGSSDLSPGLSCKNIKDSGDFNTSGTYWIRPAHSSAAFKGYCNMSAVGKWMKVPQSWIADSLSGGVTLTYSGGDNGLTISGQVTSYGCGHGSPSGALTLLKGYWTKIKYTQEFRGQASCWSVFGDNTKGGVSTGDHPTGLYSFNESAGDSISNEYYMGGNSHKFDGKTTKCDNLLTNFWDNPNPSVRHATVILRRRLKAEKAGIFTGTSCGTPTYKIENVFVQF